MSDGCFHMVCCTDVICHEVAQKAATQKGVALSYALAMRSEDAGVDKPDWKAINAAIVARWKLSGLDRVKKRAWNLNTGKAKP